MTVSLDNLSCLERGFLRFLSDYSSEMPASKLNILNEFPISGRTFRDICLSLRLKGYKICFSLNGGYYIAENEDEYKDFRSRYTSYSNKIKKAVSAMNESALYKNDIKCMLNA